MFHCRLNNYIHTHKQHNSDGQSQIAIQFNRNLTHIDGLIQALHDLIQVLRVVNIAVLVL